jgi:hypothetical protein
LGYIYSVSFEVITVIHFHADHPPLKSAESMCRRLITLLIVGSTLPIAYAAVNGCQTAPRQVGLFGAMDQPKTPVELSKELRAQLPTASLVREVKKTSLTSTGEQVILYDTDDGTKPNPQIAIVTKGVLNQTFELAHFVQYGEFAVYATSCEFQMSADQRALAIAYTNSGDGTSSIFLIVTWSSAAKYDVVFHRHVGQGRIVLESGRLELWERTMGKYASLPDSPKFECEWCEHQYLITQFTWLNSKYSKTQSRRTSEFYNPAEISSTPIQILANR